MSSLPPPNPTLRVSGLRANALAALVMLLIQYSLGISVNLYSTLPGSDQGSSLFAGFASAVGDGPVLLSLHALLGTLLLFTASAALIRSLRLAAAAPIALTTIALLSIVVAWLAVPAHTAITSGLTPVNAQIHPQTARRPRRTPPPSRWRSPQHSPSSATHSSSFSQASQHDRPRTKANPGPLASGREPEAHTQTGSSATLFSRAQRSRGASARRGGRAEASPLGRPWRPGVGTSRRPSFLRRRARPLRWLGASTRQTRRFRAP